jgi:hypothetical protein
MSCGLLLTAKINGKLHHGSGVLDGHAALYPAFHVVYMFILMGGIVARLSCHFIKNSLGNQAFRWIGQLIQI